MNNYKKWLMVLCLGVFSSNLAIAQKPQIATVDMQKLFKEYHRTIQTHEHFAAEYTMIQKNLDVRRAVVRRMSKKITAIAEELKKDGISDEDKKAKQSEGRLIAQEIKFAQRSIQLFGVRQRAVVAQKKALSMESIMTEIKKQVSAFSEKSGYNYVFDRSGLSSNQIGFFLYLKDAKDITPIILKRLNETSHQLDS